MAKKKYVIDLNIQKISDEVLKKKAQDDTPLEKFQQEVRKHEEIKGRLK